jgi:hypothetical protein
MTSAIFYVDESGDLGWNFSAPYLRGGSSRHITIATLVCPLEKKYLPKRLIRHLYTSNKWNTKREKKWSDMGITSKKQFASDAHKLAENHSDIKLFSMTAAKQQVNEAIKKDENILYNYMIKLSLIDEMVKYDRVILTQDARSIKVKSGNSLRDYLRINLACEQDSATELLMNPCDSACNVNVQFADMLAGLVQNHYENANSECWNLLQEYIKCKRLYFPH